jgi:hypothetical protein
MTDIFFINLHKVLVFPVVLGLMWWYGNVSIEMCIYLALHGTYSLLWLMKQSMYPDRRFEVRRPAWIGVLFVFLPLAGYYIAPYLIASRHPSLPAPVIAAIVSLYTFGVFFHYVGDAQKYFTLRAGPVRSQSELYGRDHDLHRVCIALRALAAVRDRRALVCLLLYSRRSRQGQIALPLSSLCRLPRPDGCAHPRLW